MTPEQRQAAGRAGGLVGGKSRSTAKVAAARKNGTKGGRPPARIDALEAVLFERGPAAFAESLVGVHNRELRALAARLGRRLVPGGL